MAESSDLDEADEGDSAEAVRAELLAHHLERALLDTPEENAHIFLAGAQVLLLILRVMLKDGRPLAHLAVQDPDRQAECGGGDQRRRVNQHLVLDQGELDQVLRQVEELVLGLRDFSEALQEPIAAKECQVELKRDQDRALHVQDFFTSKRAIADEDEVIEICDVDLLVL